MKLIDRIKNMFKRGGYALTGQTLNSIIDHPKISMSQAEYNRIADDFRRYQNEPNMISFRNSNGTKKKRKQSTINMIKKVAAEYTKVLFNEQAEIVVGETKDENGNDLDNEVNEWVNQILENNDFKKKFTEYLEPAMATGGLAIRPYYDQETGRIKFSWALSNAFYPLKSNTNNISEAALSFLYQETEGDKTIYYTLLEFHEWIDGIYTISNELYRSETSDKLGKRVVLSTLFPDLQPVAEIPNAKHSLFVYLRTAGFNNINLYSPLGLGVCDNAKDTLENINQTYDEFRHEIRRGKRRTAVSDMLLNSRTQEDGSIKQFFDDDEDVFQMLPASNIDDYSVKDLTTSIRSSEYIEAINQFFRILEMEVELSAGTFLFDGGSVRSTKTATEVVSEQSQTYQSRNKQITQVEKFIKELVIAVCTLGSATVDKDGKAVFAGGIPLEDEIGVDLDDGIFVDKEAQKTYYTSLSDKGLLPGWYVLQKLMNIPETEAKELYKQAQLDRVERTVPRYYGSAGTTEE